MGLHYSCSVTGTLPLLPSSHTSTYSINQSVNSSDTLLPPEASPKGVATAVRSPPLPIHTLPPCPLQPISPHSPLTHVLLHPTFPSYCLAHHLCCFILTSSPFPAHTCAVFLLIPSPVPPYTSSLPLLSSPSHFHLLSSSSLVHFMSPSTYVVFLLTPRLFVSLLLCFLAPHFSTFCLPPPMLPSSSLYLSIYISDTSSPHGHLPQGDGHGRVVSRSPCSGTLSQCIPDISHLLSLSLQYFSTLFIHFTCGLPCTPPLFVSLHLIATPVPPQSYFSSVLPSL